MTSKNNNGIQWTNLELKGLLEDEDSCVSLERFKKHLGLLPYHLNDLNGSLRDILNSTLNFYDSELKGFVLAYRSPKLFAPCGEMLYDTPFIHVDIEADFYIFRPKVGKSLKGFVNKKGVNHIGILVHKAFNVSVPKPEYTGENEEEYCEWPGDKVKVGQEIRFTLEQLDHKTRLPYIRGSVKEEEYLQGCKLFNEQIAALHESEFQEITRWNSKKGNSDSKKIKLNAENKKIVFDSDGEEEKNTIGEESPSKEKKSRVLNPEVEDSTVRSPSKKRKKHTEVETEDELNQKSLIDKLPEQTNDIENITNSQTKKHKKKSKDKLEYETEDEKRHKSTIQHLDNEECQDEVEETPKKSKKQKKRNTECTDTEDERNHKKTIDKNLNTSEETESEVPKKKKRKRSSLEQEHFLQDTEDERNYKKVLKEFVTEDSNKSSKKRRSSFVENVPVDTEDEKNYKTSLKNWMNGENSETECEEPSRKRKKKRKHSENDSEFIVPDAPPKKKKKNMTVKEDSLMDTEDEKKYKSYLKTLVESMEGEKQGNCKNSEVKDETKQEIKKKLKKEKKLKEFTE